jgi:hypothetical protein
MPKPVLMTVDDDPGVSRSVARDLRGVSRRVVAHREPPLSALGIAVLSYQETHFFS